jgi:predicted Zn finger-like uncharacterized protein
MNLQCPLCKSHISIDDSLAGQTVQCPQCQGKFQAPMLFLDPEEEAARLAARALASAASAAPGAERGQAVLTDSLATASQPLPAGLSLVNGPDARPAEQLPPVAAKADPAPGQPDALAAHATAPQPAKPAVGSASQPRDGTEPQLSVQLPKEFFGYAVPVLLAVALILSLFSWNGAYPAGYSVYYQNAWGALFARFGYEPTGESVLKLRAPLGESVTSSWWMLLYLPCLVLGLALALASVLVPLLNVKLPPTLQPIWPYRRAILGGLCLLGLLALVAQALVGFGLERAITEQIYNRHAEVLSKVEIPSDVQKAKMAYAAELAPYRVGRTWAFTLSLWCQLLVLVSLGLDAWMVQRADRPPPRLELRW